MDDNGNCAEVKLDILSGVGKQRLKLKMTSVTPWREERPCVERGL